MDLLPHDASRSCSVSSRHKLAKDFTLPVRLILFLGLDNEGPTDFFTPPHIKFLRKFNKSDIMSLLRTPSRIEDVRLCCLPPEKMAALATLSSSLRFSSLSSNSEISTRIFSVSAQDFSKLIFDWDCILYNSERNSSAVCCFSCASRGSSSSTSDVLGVDGLSGGIIGGGDSRSCLGGCLGDDDSSHGGCSNCWPCCSHRYCSSGRNSSLCWGTVPLVGQGKSAEPSSGGDKGRVGGSDADSARANIAFSVGEDSVDAQNDRATVAFLAGESVAVSTNSSADPIDSDSRSKDDNMLAKSVWEARPSLRSVPYPQMSKSFI